MHSLEEREKTLTAKWPRNTALAPEMVSAAIQVLENRQGHVSENDGKEIILAQPIEFANQFWGAIVLRMTSRSQADLRATYHLLQWGRSWLELLVHQHAPQQPAAITPNLGPQISVGGEDHEELLRLLSLVLMQPSLKQSATALVNELTYRLGCNRVSFGLTKGHTVDLIAVSNSASFDKRAHTMQLVIHAMEEAIEQREALHQPPVINMQESVGLKNEQQESETQQGLLLRNHDLLRRENNQGAVHTLLLRKMNQVLGALTIEENPERPLQNLPLVQQLIHLLTPLFAVKQQASAGFLQHGRNSINDLLQHYFGARHALGKYATFGATLLVALMLVPAEYWVKADATLESSVKRVVAAPQDGYILTALARPGTEVQAGDTLAQLDNREQLLEQRKWSSQLQQYRQEYDIALANYQRTQASILNTQVEQARIQLLLIEEQLKRTKLLAPISGLIVSDDISQSLGAPVKQGQILFEVAPLDHYRVKLYVDERELSGIAVEQPGRLVLSSLPGEIFDFRVTRILPLTELRDGRNFFRVEGELINSSPLIRPGMTGLGKVLVGERRLGWLWFHDSIDWLRLTLWL